MEKHEKKGNSEAVDILKQVKYYIPTNQDKGYNNMVDDGAHGWYSSGFNTVVMKRVPDYFFDGVDIPSVLEPLVDFASFSDEQSINATLTHEFTHAWLEANTRNYGSRDVSGALNEIFAYYTSYVVGGYKFSNSDSDLYDRPDMIRWGVQLLVDKTEEFRDRGRKTG